MTPGTPAWLGRALTGAGLAMVPWLFVLAARLPASARAAHWAAAWVGLDSLEALSLLGTGVLLTRRDDRSAWPPRSPPPCCWLTHGST
jgi:hypothetical protein